MSSLALRRLAVAGVAALSVAAPISAYAAPHGHGGAHAAKPAHESKQSGTKKNESKKHHGKPAPKHFTAVGTVTAVDAAAGTVTLADKGGSKDLHGKTVTVTVSPSTKVTRDDAPSSLDQVQPGDHVSANGDRGAAGALAAKHVNAESPEAPEAEPSDSATPEATESAAPEPSETAAPEPSETSTPDATQSATTTG